MLSVEQASPQISVLLCKAELKNAELKRSVEAQHKKSFFHLFSLLDIWLLKYWLYFFLFPWTVQNYPPLLMAIWSPFGRTRGGTSSLFLLWVKMFPFLTKIECSNIPRVVRGVMRGKRRNTETCLYEQSCDIVPGRQGGEGGVLLFSVSHSLNAFKLPRNEIVSPQLESVLLEMLTSKWPPCLYLDPWDFHLLFPSILLRRGSERVAEWVCGSWSWSAQHSPARLVLYFCILGEISFISQSWEEAGVSSDQSTAPVKILS